MIFSSFSSPGPGSHLWTAGHCHLPSHRDGVQTGPSRIEAGVDSPCPHPQDAIGISNQVTLDGPGLCGNSTACVTPKQQDWGTTWEIPHGVNKIHHLHCYRQPHPNTNCCSAAPLQRPWTAHVAPHRPPDYSSICLSCRGIARSRHTKAIAFLANTDSSLFSVNIYPPLNKKLLLHPCGRSQRPCNKLIRSYSAYQQRTCFCCS